MQLIIYLYNYRQDGKKILKNIDNVIFKVNEIPETIIVNYSSHHHLINIL